MATREELLAAIGATPTRTPSTVDPRIGATVSPGRVAAKTDNNIVNTGLAGLSQVLQSATSNPVTRFRDTYSNTIGKAFPALDFTKTNPVQDIVGSLATAASPAGQLPSRNPFITTTGGTPSRTSVSGGGGRVSAGSTPSFYTADALANRFGITYDADDILSLLNEATATKFDTQEEELRRARREQGIASASVFDQLLQNTRQAEGVGVAGGATLGARSANFIQQYQTAATELSNLEQIYSDELVKLSTGEAEEMSQNAVDAFNKSQELRQFLGQLSATVQANDIQRYIGELSANATTAAAGISAGAQVGAQTAYIDRLEEILGPEFIQQYFAGQISN